MNMEKNMVLTLTKIKQNDNSRLVTFVTNDILIGECWLNYKVFECGPIDQKKIINNEY